MKNSAFNIAAFLAIFGFVADLIFSVCGQIAVIGVAVRRRIRAVGIAAIAVILVVGATASALASRDHPPVEPLPVGDQTTIAALDEYDSDAAAPLNRFRLGNSPFAIIETQYSDSGGNPQVIVSSLRYANVGVWFSDDDKLGAGDYTHEVIADNIVAPPPVSAKIGRAIYLIEGDAFYQNVRYYPDGYVKMNFNDGSFNGRLSALGEDADDDFGPGARVPNGNGGVRHVTARDKFVLDFSGIIGRTDDRFDFYEGSRTALNVVESGGFFSNFFPGTPLFWSRFYGRFHDADDYDNTVAAPAELSGKFVVRNRENEATDGWFLGRQGGGPPPALADTVTLRDLNFFDYLAAAPPIFFRQGDEPYSIAEKEYRDSNRNPQVIVQSLEYAHLGVWVNGSTLSVGNFGYASLADNAVAPPTISAGAGKAIYIIEGDAVYNGARFYPDGYLNADFDSADISGRISIRGENAVDHFGSDPWLPDSSRQSGRRSVAPDDDLVIDLSGGIAQDGAAGFSGTEISIVEASGFFNRFPAGRKSGGGFDGRFYDANSYADAPVELAGKFGVFDSNYRGLIGGFLGKWRSDLPAPSDSVTIADLEKYDGAPAILAPDEARAGSSSDETFPRRPALSIGGKQFDDIIDNSPQVIVQMQEYAYLGIWMNGDASAVADFKYQPLADNVVTPPSASANAGRATYDIEGDVVYNDARFYPDGYLSANFNTGRIGGAISISGGQPEDDLGGLPDDADDSVLAMHIIDGEINPSGETSFKGGAIITVADGFFSDFQRGSIHNKVISGRFYDGGNYNPSSVPAELAGTFDLTDGESKDMLGGFLGKKQ